MNDCDFVASLAQAIRILKYGIVPAHGMPRRAGKNERDPHLNDRSWFDCASRIDIQDLLWQHIIQVRTDYIAKVSWTRIPGGVDVRSTATVLVVREEMPSFELFTRRIRSGWRLAVGSAMLPRAIQRGRSSKPAMISIDVFETLVSRRTSADVLLLEGTERAAELARRNGLSVPPNPLQTRRFVERKLSSELKSRGKDPEFSHQQAIQEMLAIWGAREWAEGAAREIATWELERETAITVPHPTTTAWLREWIRTGTRVVAVSDTRYTATELQKLLSQHGITGLSAIYASADHMASKFSGRLFGIVAAREQVSLSDILHVGDNVLTDGVSAAQRGIAVRLVHAVEHAALPDAPPHEKEEDQAFAFGYRKLGPILVAFTGLLFARAEREGVGHLAFVARDGELLFRIAQAIAATDARLKDIRLRYVHLSRRSVSCASADLQNLGQDNKATERVIAALRNVRGMGTVIESFRSYFNFPPELVSAQCDRLGLERGDQGDLEKLLADEEATRILVRALEPERERLLEYLLQEEILSSDCALVDIGWRGSLQKILQSQSREWGRPSPRGYYFGMWNEGRATFPKDGIGLISDQRRGRGLLEGAAWHAAFLLEAVCRASHGIVVGYARDSDGTIKPIHVEVGGTREAERQSEETQARVQNGIMAYTGWYAKGHRVLGLDETSIRRHCQHELRRIAFFPTRAEREVGQKLVYSEPTSDAAALNLVARPGKGIPGWLAGLRSPWKGAYLTENGGRLPATVYCAGEAILSRLPAGAKPLLRGLMIRHE